MRINPPVKPPLIWHKETFPHASSSQLQKVKEKKKKSKKEESKKKRGEKEADNYTKRLVVIREAIKAPTPANRRFLEPARGTIPPRIYS